MYIILAIDILNGKVVRLREGDYDQVTSYDVTLEEMIDKYQSNGTEIIHIIDLNGAKGDFSNQKFLFDMIKKTDIKVQYGGGVRSIEKVKELIDSGIHRVIVGTQALTNNNFLAELSQEICGKEKCQDQVVVAIDVLDEVEGIYGREYNATNGGIGISFNITVNSSLKSQLKQAIIQLKQG